MKVKIVNKSKHDLPHYATNQSAGMDLRANLVEPIVLKTLERTLVKTGLFIELPIGYEAQIRPRSGLSYKKGITVLNSPGTIDADYRGEIGVILVNLSPEEFVIEEFGSDDPDRIALAVKEGWFSHNHEDWMNWSIRFVSEKRRPTLNSVIHL